LNMKVSSLLFSAALAAPGFEQWASNHGKAYKTEAEKASRLATFQQNSAIVDKLNSDEEDSAVYSLDGPFADLTPEEFSQKMLMTPREAPAFHDKAERLTVAASNAPASVDWRAKGAVTAVKNQGSLGTCWAFSAIGNLEGQLFLKTQQLTDLSVEQLVECDNSSDPKNGTADCGEFGGWPYLAYQYFERAGGVRTDAEMPYCSGIEFEKPGNCMPCMASGYSKSSCDSHDDDYYPLFCNRTTTKGQVPGGLCSSSTGVATTVTGWNWVSSDEAEIASVLASTGPLSVALNAQTLQFYKKGVFSPKLLPCNPKNLDHGVLIVGYGTDSVDYWTVKNSWGAKWGEDGYFRISRGKGTCGINTQVTTGIVL